MKTSNTLYTLTFKTLAMLSTTLRTNCISPLIRKLQWLSHCGWNKPQTQQQPSSCPVRPGCFSSFTGLFPASCRPRVCQSGPHAFLLGSQILSASFYLYSQGSSLWLIMCLCPFFLQGGKKILCILQSSNPASSLKTSVTPSSTICTHSSARKARCSYLEQSRYWLCITCKHLCVAWGCDLCSSH